MTASPAVGSHRRAVQRAVPRQVQPQGHGTELDRHRSAGPGGAPIRGLARALLDNAPAALAVIGTERIEVNAAFRSIFGCAPDASLEDLSLLFVPDVRDRLRASLQSVLAGAEPRVTLDAVGVRADGSQFPTRLTAARIEGTGAMLGIVYVVDLSEQEQARAVVRLTTERLSAIVELAGSLNLKTVAEGIEQPEQLDILRTMGCQMGQGFYLARPMTVGRMDELIRGRLPPESVA